MTNEGIEMDSDGGPDGIDAFRSIEKDSTAVLPVPENLAVVSQVGTPIAVPRFGWCGSNGSLLVEVCICPVLCPCRG